MVQPPNLLTLPLELKLLIIDELKQIDDVGLDALSMQRIWPDIRELIFIRTIDEVFVSDVNGNANKYIRSTLDDLFEYPGFSSATKGFSLSRFSAPQSTAAAVYLPALFSHFTRIRTLEFFEFDFISLDMAAFCAAIPAISTLSMVRLSRSTIQLRHLYILFTSLAGLQDVTLYLTALRIPDFHAGEEMPAADDEDFVEEQPDIFSDFARFEFPPFTGGTFRVKTLEYYALGRDDYMLLDAFMDVSVFPSAPQVESLVLHALAPGLENLSRRLRRLLERTRSTLKSLRLCECSYDKALSISLPPLDIGHLTRLQFHGFVRKGEASFGFQWVAESLNALPVDSKLETVAIDFVMVDEEPAFVRLPRESKDRDRVWKMFDNALTRERLYLARVEYEVFVLTTKHPQFVEDPYYGLNQWVLEFGLPAVWKKYFPEVTFEKSWEPPVVQAEDSVAEIEEVPQA
ncbi:hypothetical protein BDZ89DRAFT_1071793 [Hymenopellis radicata]|nr:hypothetical protein BDZ89DRAFT_1071793 [Hymenopellis radicata]